MAELLLGGAAAFTGNVVHDNSEGRDVVSLHWRRGLLMPHFVERVVRWDCFPTVDKSAPSSTSAADDMTFLMICAMVRTVPLLGGLAASFDMKKCPPDQLQALVSER